jgi:hypothetical protein
MYRHSEAFSEYVPEMLQLPICQDFWSIRFRIKNNIVGPILEGHPPAPKVAEYIVATTPGLEPKELCFII